MKWSNRYLLILLVSTFLQSCGGESSDVTGGGSTSDSGSFDRVAPAFDELVPPDAVIEKLAGDFAFTEGPVWDRRNNQLYFSDLRSNAIHTWSDADGLGTYLQPVFEGDAGHDSVGSNGLTIDSEGRLLLMEHGNRVVSRIEADGSRTILAERWGDGRLNSPNDSVWHANGWLYFTDPPYGLAGQEQDPLRELQFNGIYRVHPDTGEVQLLERNQSRPNGIALSLDGSTLYVANSDGSNKVWYSYDVAYDGQLSNQRVFFDVNDQDAPGAADGMKIDVNGNIFATGPGGVWVFDPEGNHLGTIKPPEVPANVAWGDDGSTLYMTARTGLYRVKLSTRGEIL
ncbi:MAG: SMP-30/gluconolactonase/LRE family protein [Pseudomonadales bacterium]|nr:SMP-30/gluconolactonase/LRE family protein [Pseudomonadales bacterium]